MSGIDWGAYLDGSVSPEERSAIESRLQSCPDTRRDLEAFCEFRRALREAALTEGIPERRLQALMAEIASRRSGRLTHWKFALGAVALLLIAFAGYRVFVFDPLMPHHPRALARLATSDPVRAAEWAASQTQLNVPIVRLAGAATMVCAQCGEDWVCYDFDVGEGIVCLLMKGGTSEFTGARPDSIAGVAVFVGKGIGWHWEAMSFYVSGGSEAARRRVAEAAIQEIASQQVRALRKDLRPPA